MGLFVTALKIAAMSLRPDAQIGTYHLFPRLNDFS